MKNYFGIDERSGNYLCINRVKTVHRLAIEWMNTHRHNRTTENQLAYFPSTGGVDVVRA